MDPDSKRRMVSLDQLNSLLDFMKEHPDLATGLSRGRRGKLMSLKVWNTCAKILNTVDVNHGVVKDGKGWAKYWCDWKYRVRRHALEVKAAKDSDRPPPDGLTPLSPIEETIINIIGDNLDGLVIKSDPDPLADADSNEDVPDSSAEHDKETPPSQYYATRSHKRKRRNSSKDTSDLDNNYRKTSSPDATARITEDADGADKESARFLRLEEKNLENSKIQTRALQKIASEMTRLADIMDEIKERLVNGFPNT